jgi:antitoxin YefM
MNAVTYTNLRQNLKTWMDKVCSDHEALIITRKNNENVVLVSADDYNSLIETHYLLSNEANARHLQRSINQRKSGKARERKLQEDEKTVH